MTKRQRPPPSTQQQLPFDIAVNILLRCEHFLRSLAFQSCQGEESVKEIQKLFNDFHETLFIIDHALHKYRIEHKLNNSDQAQEDHTTNAYRLLSEINEQLTDYAFLIGHKIHPWDIPYVFEESNSVLTDADTSPDPAPRTYAQQIKFPPATWKNRVLRQTTTPLAGFPLENSAHNDDTRGLTS
ncbi:hypothetical protein UA08_08728 [Talaromyces atroroseus]|uniref:Uncharacterized protein n=1 Tax=Talaromyces atroroseus TaxID=1441469 RepID=A0A225ANX0_TALAT|nr:hypothetical protein UA08_08728 [Talaromyces atroroseus]OKL56125.1 hypothetical protein UA08_08728 [Talaromyces atroroseus]